MILNLEGRRVAVQISPRYDVAWAGFVLADRLDAFMENNCQRENPWLDVVGWKDTRKALSQIWGALTEMANGMPIGIDALDARRAHLYVRLLRRAGLNPTALACGDDGTLIS